MPCPHCLDADNNPVEHDTPAEKQACYEAYRAAYRVAHNIPEVKTKGAKRNRAKALPDSVVLTDNEPALNDGGM